VKPPTGSSLWVMCSGAVDPMGGRGDASQPTATTTRSGPRTMNVPP
jgi:hypothetical protein